MPEVFYVIFSKTGSHDAMESGLGGGLAQDEIVTGAISNETAIPCSHPMRHTEL